jgi:hypothetical protein
MMKNLPPIPNWAFPALQGLAYWLGSQYALGLAANISEGAIAWELSRLLFTHRSDSRVLEAEVLYRDIPEFNSRGQLDDSQERADLVIVTCRRAGRDVPYRRGDVEAIVEIKHNRSQKRLVWRDIDFFGVRKSESERIRAFLIYASINERPEDFTQENGKAIKPRTSRSPSGKAIYKVRRVCRATWRVPEENRMARGHYAILVEVG